MTTKDDVYQTLKRLALPDGGDLVSRDMIRAVVVEADTVRFIIEAPSAEIARQMEPLRKAAEELVGELDGVSKVTAALSAPTAQPGGTATKAPPSLKLGGHPTGKGSIKPDNVKRIIAVGSGKGGVGKSTVSVNLAVALAQQGKKVGLLDADIYGPSVPRMMGITKRAESPDGQAIIPEQAYGVTVMSIGMMIENGRAVIWRGPMLMGALQQMLTQVQWGELDVLLVDMPPGTGDVQLTLSQRAEPSGAILVSTPQDVALLDVRRAVSMFQTLKTPVLGLIENMSFHICAQCGHEEHIFGHGGVAKESEEQGLPFLGALPIDLQTRIGGDSGKPVASGEGPVAEAYRTLARRFIDGGMI